VPTVVLVILSTENLYEASATLFILPETSDSVFSEISPRRRAAASTSYC